MKSLNRTNKIELPTRSEQKMARESIQQMSNLSIKNTNQVSVSFQINHKKQSLKISPKVFSYLKFILINMAEGKALQLTPVEPELSTQEAADRLNVSRPHLVKLLEQGAIPFKKVGTHRRVGLQDLLDYERKQEAIRNKQLDFLAGQAQDLNLGYK